MFFFQKVLHVIQLAKLLFFFVLAKISAANFPCFYILSLFIAANHQKNRKTAYLQSFYIFGVIQSVRFRR